MAECPRILQATALPNKKLKVTFDNGRIKIYDCNQLLKRPEFALLKNDSFFMAIRVDAGGYGVSWNDKIDLSEYELWTNGTEMHVAERAPAMH